MGTKLQKAFKAVLAVMGRFLLLGLSIQIVLGFLWMCCSFGCFPKFAESLHVIEAARTLVCDEYTGILYPLLIMLTKGMERLLSIPYTYILYTLQLLTAFYAGCFFLKKLGVRGRVLPVWGSLALLTFPMAMQSHMAVLPVSLTGSFYLLELGGVCQAVRRKEPFGGFDLLVCNVCWLLAALLSPDYFWLGALPILLLYVWDLVKYRKEGVKRLVYHLLLIAACGGLILGVGELTQQEGSYGRVHKSFQAALFRRVAWKDAWSFYTDWPEEMQAAYDREELKAFENAPYAVGTLLQPAIEQTVGVEKAKEWFGEYSCFLIYRNYRRLLHAVVWDMAGYACPTLVTQMQLSGRGYSSYTGRNYELLREGAPRLTGTYMDYSNWMFLIGTAVMVVAWGLRLPHRRRSAEKGNGFLFFVCLCAAGSMILWYTMQGAGMFDYKNGVFAGELWLIGMIWQVDRLIQGADEESEREACGKDTITASEK